MNKKKMRSLDINEYYLDPAIPVTVIPVGPGTDFPIHSHDFSELVVVHKGRGTHLVGDTEMPLRAGDVFLIRSDLTHGYCNCPTMELTNILFDRSVAFPDESDLRTLPGYHALFLIEPHYRTRQSLGPCLHLKYDSLRHIERWINELHQELLAHAPGGRTVCLAILSRMLVFLCRAYEERPNTSSQKLLRLAETVSWMETHAHEAVGVNDLCDMAHMARSTFHRIFSEVYHMAPLEYMLQLRIRRAAGLLRDSSMPITELALACGFSDGNYFARQFRQQMGLSPSSYRKQFGQ